MANNSNHVAEMQGLYGPFTIAERVVQKIWLRGDFDHCRAVLADGRKLEIRSAGTWNLLGGPDFRGASLIIAGQSVTGDRLAGNDQACAAKNRPEEHAS